MAELRGIPAVRACRFCFATARAGGCVVNQFVLQSPQRFLLLGRSLSRARSNTARRGNKELISRDSDFCAKKRPQIYPERSAPPFVSSHFSFALSAVEPGKAWRIARSAPHGRDSGTLPAAARAHITRAHITRCSSGLNLLNCRVIAVTMLYVPPHRLRMPIALKLANFQHPCCPRWLLQEVWLCTDQTPGTPGIGGESPWYFRRAPTHRLGCDAHWSA